MYIYICCASVVCICVYPCVLGVRMHVIIIPLLFLCIFTNSTLLRACVCVYVFVCVFVCARALVCAPGSLCMRVCVCLVCLSFDFKNSFLHSSEEKWDGETTLLPCPRPPLL